MGGLKPSSLIEVYACARTVGRDDQARARCLFYDISCIYIGCPCTHVGNCLYMMTVSVSAAVAQASSPCLSSFTSDEHILA